MNGCVIAMNHNTDANMQRALWAPSFLISTPQSKLEQIALVGFYGNLKEQLRHAIPLVVSTAAIWPPFPSLHHRTAKRNKERSIPLLSSGPVRMIRNENEYKVDYI